MNRFRLLAFLFVFGLVGAGCNTGYIMGPDEVAEQPEVPAESVQSTVPAEAE
jgi:hypothetical protein